MRTEFIHIHIQATFEFSTADNYVASHRLSGESHFVEFRFGTQGICICLFRHFDSCNFRSFARSFVVFSLFDFRFCDECAVALRLM